jgi:hypothetical protein
VAQLDLSTEVIESRWGPHEVTSDDLGPWLTFAFVMDDGTKTALVREVENAPHPGYILTAVSQEEPEDALSSFLAEARLPDTCVLHRSSD